MRSQFSLRIISNYAKSLFDVACKHKKIDLIFDQVMSISDFLSANYNCIRVSGVFLCKSIFTSRFDGIVKNFIYILSKNDRISLLPEIINKYTVLVDQHRNTKIAEITFAVNPKKQELDKLIKLISDKMSCRVIPKIRIDANLLWGVIIDIENTRFDGSYRAMINKMRGRQDKFVRIIYDNIVASVN